MSDGNGCNHVRVHDAREGDDLVTRCAASGCGAEVARTRDYYAGTGDDDD